MTNSPHYVMRGGAPGRERLRVLHRVTAPGTDALLERIGVRSGWHCLDVGCGGGDVTVRLAQLVRPGIVVAIDVDEAQLDIARGEAAAAGHHNVEFRAGDIDRYVTWYCAAHRAGGGDPTIGRRLPHLVRAVGLELVGVNVVHPAGLDGPITMIAPLTLAASGDAIVRHGIATPDAVAATIDELEAMAAAGANFVSMPRVVQVWATAHAV
jgi:SAM-dependent methyltransferase